MRSPKDAIQLDHIVGEAPTDRLRRQIDAMQVTDAHSVVELLASSRRVAFDISFYFKHRYVGSQQRATARVDRLVTGMPSPFYHPLNPQKAYPTTHQRAATRAIRLEAERRA